MSDPTKYRAINAALVRALPELKPRYDDETAAWGEEMGPHVIYGDLLNPYLSQLLLRASDEDEAVLRRIFGFLEEMLAHPDPHYGEVVGTTVAEHLEGHPDLLGRARRFMGPMMAEATRDPAGPRRPRRLRGR
jgi:hypothetical protein